MPTLRRESSLRSPSPRSARSKSDSPRRRSAELSVSVSPCSCASRCSSASSRKSSHGYSRSTSSAEPCAKRRRRKIEKPPKIRQTARLKTDGRGRRRLRVPAVSARNETLRSGAKQTKAHEMLASDKGVGATPTPWRSLRVNGAEMSDDAASEEIASPGTSAEKVASLAPAGAKRTQAGLNTAREGQGQSFGSSERVESAPMSPGAAVARALGRFRGTTYIEDDDIVLAQPVNSVHAIEVDSPSSDPGVTEIYDALGLPQARPSDGGDGDGWFLLPPSNNPYLRTSSHGDSELESQHDSELGRRLSDYADVDQTVDENSLPPPLTSDMLEAYCPTTNESILDRMIRAGAPALLAGNMCDEEDRESEQGVASASRVSMSADAGIAEPHCAVAAADAASDEMCLSDVEAMLEKRSPPFAGQDSRVKGSDEIELSLSDVEALLESCPDSGAADATLPDEVAVLLRELALRAEALDPKDYWRDGSWDLVALREDVAAQRAEELQERQELRDAADAAVAVAEASRWCTLAADADAADGLAARAALAGMPMELKAAPASESGSDLSLASPGSDLAPEPGVVEHVDTLPQAAPLIGGHDGEESDEDVVLCFDPYLLEGSP